MRIDARTLRSMMAISLAGCLAGCSPSGVTTGTRTSSPAAVTSAPAAAGASSPAVVPTASASPGPPSVRPIEIATLTGRIAFSAGSPHAEDVYVVDASGQHLRKVTTDPAADFDPSLSPDGAQVAYRHQTGDDATTEIHGASVDGTAVHDVSRSPDSADWGPSWGLVRLTDAPGEDGFPAWSADGTKIAFSSTRDDCRNSQAADCLRSTGIGPVHTVYMMNADGSDPRRVSPGDAMFVDWSPDGQYLVFAGAGNLEITRLDGSGLVRLPLDVSMALFPDWAP